MWYPIKRNFGMIDGPNNFKKKLIHELRQKKNLIKRVKEASPITKQSFKWEILFALEVRPYDTLHVLRLVKKCGTHNFCVNKLENKMTYYM